MLLRLYFATRVLDVSMRDIWQQIRPSFNAGVALCLVALPVYSVTDEFNPVIRLFSVSAAAVLAYTVALWSLDKRALLKMLEIAGLTKPVRAAGKSFD